MPLQPPSSSTPAQPEAKRPWVAPDAVELPRLTELTLQTGTGIPGFGDIFDGGSTVIP